MFFFYRKRRKKVTFFPYLVGQYIKVQVPGFFQTLKKGQTIYKLETMMLQRLCLPNLCNSIWTGENKRNIVHVRSLFRHGVRDRVCGLTTRLRRGSLFFSPSLFTYNAYFKYRLDTIFSHHSISLAIGIFVLFFHYLYNLSIITIQFVL